MSYRGLAPQSVLTAVGEVTVGRRYYAARDGCRCTAVPWDDWAGVPAGHKLTVAARRIVTLAGSGWSFDEAADKVRELCRLPVSDDVVRRVCDAEGEAAGRWLRGDAASAAPMAAAAGEVEFYTDGVSVNTVGGWREMRVSVFAKRAAAGPAGPDQWGDRVLEPPACRLAWAAIANSGLVGASWRRMLDHLGLAGCPRLSVLGDGARWIWDEAARRFKAVVNVEWVVDVYHVAEHVHACGQRMFGPGTAAARAWGAGRLAELVDLEGPRFIGQLQRERAAAATVTAATVTAATVAAATVAALDELIGYLTANRDSLWYRTRLAQGLPIGSGLVEGTCKNLVGKRLKLNNPRWRVRRAEHMAALRCLHYSKLWPAYWDSKAAKLAA